MGLTASEESADPGALLARLIEIAQIRGDDAMHSIGVLTFADERTELPLELLAYPFAAVFGETRLPVVDQPVLRRIALKDVANGHSSSPPSRRLGTALNLKPSAA